MAKRRDGRTKLGQFKPGKSGNPSGLPKKKDVAHSDDWSNFFTGFGVAGRDKRIGTEFRTHNLSWDQLRDLWLGDDLASRSVETIPREAIRQGYDLTVSSSQDTAGGAGMDPSELSAQVTQKLEVLGADDALEVTAKYERGYGGGAVLIGANDGATDLTQPLNLNKVRSIDWLTPLEARDLLPLYAYNDPRAPKYGQPEIYQMQSRSVLPSYSGNYAQTTVLIHESRLLVFPGIRVSRYQTMSARGGWGESVLTRVFRVLRDFNTAWSSAGVLVTDFAQAVIKISGLWEALALDGSKAFAQRLQAMDYGRSTVNALTIDANDTYERQQTPLSGLPDLLREFQTRLAAACDMPLTLLFGTSPAGMNATGESDIRLFYDRVAAFQKHKIEPHLRRLCEIIFRTIGNKRAPEKYAIKFRPLWQESAKDKASAMFTQAQADAAWIDAGVLSPEEVASSHWGKGEYDPNITVDFEAREAQEMAAAEPVSPEPEPGDDDYIPPPGPGSAEPVPQGVTTPMPERAAAPDPNTKPVQTVQSEDSADAVRCDAWSDEAREAALEARHANAATPPRAGDESRRANYASHAAGRLKGSTPAAKLEKVRANAHAADLHERAAAANPEHAAEHQAAAAKHNTETERLIAGAQRAPNAGQYAGKNPEHGEQSRTTKSTEYGEAIHANHGLSDLKGRAVGGTAHIGEHEGKFHVSIVPTRNGETFGAYGHSSTSHTTLEEARAHANAGLDKQRENFLKKSAEVSSRTGLAKNQGLEHEGKQGGQHEPAETSAPKQAPGEHAVSPASKLTAGQRAAGASAYAKELSKEASKTGSPDAHKAAAEAHKTAAGAQRAAGNETVAKGHDAKAEGHEKKGGRGEHGKKGEGLKKLGEFAKGAGEVVAGEGASKVAGQLAPVGEGGEGGEE